MNYLNEIEDEIKGLGFKIIAKDFERPWGGFLVINEDQENAHIEFILAAIGFDFPNVQNVIEKIKEEFDEFNSALLYKDKLEAEEEFGDILFSLINYSRHIGIDSNESLKKSTEKFIKRFKKVEKKLKISGNFDFSNYSEEELNLIWEQAKKE